MSVRGEFEVDSSFIAECVNKFGREHRVEHLAEVVLDVYDAAIKLSTKRTYNTGQKAYVRFITSIHNGRLFPFQSCQLGQTELNLAFFMASLLLKPSITVGTTIVGYESHVKYWFRAEGCSEDEYTTPFLRQLRSGIQKTLPLNADSRRALLLPNFMNSNQFSIIREKDSLLRFATILGFVGMLRPHTFE